MSQSSTQPLSPIEKLSPLNLGKLLSPACAPPLPRQSSDPNSPRSQVERADALGGGEATPHRKTLAMSPRSRTKSTSPRSRKERKRSSLIGFFVNSSGLESLESTYDTQWGVTLGTGMGGTVKTVRHRLTGTTRASTR